MLFFFKKYKNPSHMIIDIKHKQSHFLSISRKCAILKNSPGFRKMFFRTLLLYINLIYCSFFCNNSNNYFYLVLFMCATYSTYHPSFYLKRRSLVS